MSVVYKANLRRCHKTVSIKNVACYGPVKVYGYFRLVRCSLDIVGVHLSGAEPSVGPPDGGRIKIYLSTTLLPTATYGGALPQIEKQFNGRS